MGMSVVSVNVHVLVHVPVMRVEARGGRPVFSTILSFVALRLSFGGSDWQLARSRSILSLPTSMLGLQVGVEQYLAITYT